MTVAFYIFKHGNSINYTFLGARLSANKLPEHQTNPELYVNLYIHSYECILLYCKYMSVFYCIIVYAHFPQYVFT